MSSNSGAPKPVELKRITTDYTVTESSDKTPNEDSCFEHSPGTTVTSEDGTQSGGTKRVWKKVLYGAIICLYFVYFTLALVWNFYRAIPLLCLTLLVVSSYTWQQLSRTDVISRLRHTISRTFQSFTLQWLGRKAVRVKHVHQWKPLNQTYLFTRACYGVATAAMLTYSIVTNTHRPENLLSLAGIAVLLLFCWLLSHDRPNISLRPVLWGLGLQLCLGVLVLKTAAGAATFRWLGHQVEVFLNYVTAGVTFVFGDKYEDFFFAFKLMPTVLFVSSVMSVLYYIGVMQMVIDGIAMVMRVTMGTTALETVSTAASIFLGQPEASFTIRPYLRTMSNSELHAIMTAGFASVSADMFGLFVDYGVSSAHILTAVLMSAPAGLAVSKIVYPQPTPDRANSKQDDSHSDEPSTQDVDTPQNILDAAARGAQDAVPIVLAVGATLIAFLSILEFLNAVLTYLGSLVHIENLTMDLALSYPLMPLAFLMGVPWADCRVVGEVVGLKTVLNEFVGYQRLGKYIKEQAISVIATYALCGFSNPTTVGVTLGGLGALVPHRKQDLARLVISAWISGCVTCFLTACFAGLFYDEGLLPQSNIVGNSTSAAEK